MSEMLWGELFPITENTEKKTAQSLEGSAVGMKVVVWYNKALMFDFLYVWHRALKTFGIS